jgi:hypothetical protein
MWGSYDSGYEEYCLPGCDVVKSSRGNKHAAHSQLVTCMAYSSTLINEFKQSSKMSEKF